jgi:nicotinamide riboside kinase
LAKLSQGGLQSAELKKWKALSSYSIKEMKMIKRIGFVGGPGCGKTSLARQLTTELYNNRQLNAQQITEFARDYINECKREQSEAFEPTMADQLLIYQEQIKREDCICLDAADCLITDSPIFLPIVFAYPLFDRNSAQSRKQYLSLYDDWLANHTCRYNMIFLLKREKPFLKDGTRNEDETQAIELDMRIKGFMDLHSIGYADIAGTDEERLARVLRYLEIVK